MRCLKRNKIVFLLTGWLLVGLASSAQANCKRFTDSNAPLTPVRDCGLAWGDYDNDGDLDLALAGRMNGTQMCKIYRNDTNEVFTNIDANLPGVAGASLAWGDYDNDGDLDLAVGGYSSSLIKRITKIYRNNGAGTFTDIEAGLAGACEGSIAWGDYDNDGDLDLALTGRSDAGLVSKVYRNDTNGVFVDVGAALQPVEWSSVAWGDYDNDGDLDLALAGYYGGGSQQVTEIYRNDGGGVFTDIGAGLALMFWCSLDWGDYDNDGDLDLAIAGYRYGLGPSSKIYRNDGGGTFTDIGAVLNGAHRCSLGWGDYDNDGDLDLAIAGTGQTNIYRNDSGKFTNTNAGLVGLVTGSYYCALAWGDYDNDGDLDLALAGDTLSSSVTKLYRNDCRPVIGDLNGDCYINFQDFALFSEHWLQCSHELDPNCME